MRLEALAAAALLATAFAGCFGGSDKPQAELPTTGSIEGFVVNEAVVPMAGARVEIPGNGTVTNATGAFQFTGLAPGSYVVEASAPTFLPRQTTAIVVAGNATQVRLVLPVDVAALAFNQTFTFRGFVNLHGGEDAPEIGDCQCNFTIPIEGAWRTIVVEAQWIDTVNSPAGPTEYAWTLMVAEAEFAGSGPSPILGRADVGNESIAASSALLRVAPKSPHVYANQQFDVSATVWYGVPAPDGLRSLGL